MKHSQIRVNAVRTHSVSKREIYVTWFLSQSCGWVKIAELACATAIDAARCIERIEQESAARGDLIKLEVR